MHTQTKRSYTDYFFLFILWFGFYFSAVRYNVGKDYLSYTNKITGYLEHSAQLNFGFFYKFAIDFLDSLGFQSGAIVFVFFSINAFVFFLYASKTAMLVKDGWLSVLLVLCIPFFMLYSFNAVRFSSAFAITTYATVLFVLKGERSLRSLFLALLFHNSALIFLCLFVAANKRWMTVLSVCAMMAGAVFLSGYLELFLRVAGISGSYLNIENGLNALFLAFTLLALSNLLWKSNPEIKKIEFLRNFGILALSILLFSTFVQIDTTVVERFVIYLIGPVIVLIPVLTQELKYRNLVQLGWIAIALFTFLQSVMDSSNNIAFRIIGL